MLDTSIPVWSVSSLNASARDLLEGHFRNIWIEGEISNFSKPSSGHFYFTLKDDVAQIRCAMFRGRNRTLSFDPKDGMHVLACASVSLYEPRGDYQLIVESLQEQGTGALQRKFEMLKEKLNKEGLFAPEFKKPLPEFPHKIGIITSPTGAAIRDILSVLKRRFPLLEIIIYPTQVQGRQASPQIVQALQIAISRNECDVLILSRGGGSIEDLWPFNEEIVARAIVQCPIPLISGVGHEVDFTIADFVADIRAPTPSAAAELISPNQLIWQQKLVDGLQWLIRHMEKNFQERFQQLHHLKNRIRHPREKVHSQMQTVDFLEQRLQRAFLAKIQQLQQQLLTLQYRLEKHPLKENLQQKLFQMECLSLKIHSLIKLQFQKSKEQLSLYASQLHALSPLATLDRGYSVTLDNKGHVISSALEISQGEHIKTKLKDGEVESLVVKIFQANA
jgi:exodeoxyribonuclease VII large subunit